MSGHSKWVNIRLRKGSQDAKRGKLFTKAAKEIILAAKGGGDPSTNSRLRAAIAGAKAVNLPKDKIEAAIRKGTGQEAGGDLTEIMYEGHAPCGIAVIVETATDNRNRTVAEIRHIMDKSGGSMGDSGCVAWMFDRKGVIVLTKEKYPDEDSVTEAVLDAGAEDLSDKGEVWEIYTSMADFAAVREALEGKGFEMESAELQMVPKTLQAVDAEMGAKVMKFIDALEDCEDVQNVYTNADFPDDMED